MCIAVYKPPSVEIKDENLRECWIGNPDGAGFAYVVDGLVVIEKGFMYLKDFMPAYKRAFAEHPLSPFAIHFRIRSQGAKSPDNTHPFRISGGALIHNGTLTGTGSTYDSGPSDTALFCMKYADWLSFDRANKYKKDWETSIQTYNKMVMLYNDGSHVILNEEKGVVDESNGVWYSNTGFRPPATNRHSYAHTGAPNNPYGHSGYAEGYGHMHGMMH